MNRIFAFLLIILLCSGCEDGNAKKETLITHAVTAIVEKDYRTILSIIDTPYFFYMYGKESFLKSFDLASDLIVQCNERKISKKLIPINNEYLNTTEYNIDFCTQNGKGNNKLTIKFSFFNHKSSKQISMIDFVFHQDLKSTPANMPVPKN